MSRSYPPSLENVRGGELGNILAEMAACDELDLSITRWEQQLEQYQATVNNATPDSDIVAVAAAKAGIEVVRRAIDRANEELASHGADVLGDVFSDVFNEMWY